MTLKDITKEQAIQIAELAYGGIDQVKSSFEFFYTEGFHEDISKGIYEDTPEMIGVIFDTFKGNETVKIRVFIYNDLNIKMDIFKTDPIKSIPLSPENLHKIYDKFKEWEIKPIDKDEYDI